MFRLKITLVLAFALAAGAFGASQLIGSGVGEVEERLREDVGHTYLAYERVKKLRDLQLKDAASSLASSEIGAYLGVLADYRKRMLEIESEVYQAIPGPPNDEALQDARTAFVKERRGEFLAAFAEDLANRLERARGARAWQDKSREETISEIKESVAVCNSFGVNNCVYRLSYVPLEAVVREARTEERFGFRPDLVVLVDHRGVGVADADRSSWSDQIRFGADYPVTTEVKKGVILRDIIKLRESDYYFVTAAPIFEQKQFRGAVLVGIAIDADLMREEGEILGRSVGYLDGKEIVRSEFDDKFASEVRHNLPPQLEPPRYAFTETDRLLAQFVPVTGNATNNRMRVVLAVDKAAVTASLHEGRTWVWIIAVGLFALGLLVMIRFQFVFSAPFVQIDAGMHEVINGNKDYVFADKYHEAMWVTLANNLNLLVGSLTGREAPSEDEHWAEEMLDEQNRAEEAESRRAGRPVLPPEGPAARK